jgi:amino acid adenylation domain-containing protein/non-ribosomal peptide synthase protein (TIGR01720 family)
MTDNFFDLGGHSLLATQVMSRVKDSLGVDLPLRSLFDAPILAAFGDRVEAARRAGAPQAPPIVSVPRDGVLPVSFAQQRLLFLETLAPGTSLYHIPIATRIEGRLDFSVLARSFTELLRRHEILRTSFETVEGHWIQVIAPPRELLPGSVDLSGLTAGERERESARLVAEDAQCIFDLVRGPLLRVTVLRLAPEEHLVLITLHHAVADGWSIGVLVQELTAIVSAYFQNELPTLPEIHFQYADFASWQRHWLSGAMLTEQLAYWRRQIGPSLIALELPTDRPRSAIRSWRGDVVRMRFDAALADGLRALSRQHGTTLFMTLLAAFDTILARYSGQDEVVVGSPIANRTRAEWEKLIGFFVNTLALRGDLRGDPSFLGLMDRVREVALGAYEHQDLPYEMLVEDLHAERDLSRTPVFQVLFVLQNAPAEVLELPGLRLSVVNVGTGASKFDWTLSLNESAGGLDGWIEYASDLFDTGTLDRFVGHLEILLGGLLENPARRLSDLPLLSVGERAELLAATQIVPIPTNEGLVQRFESAADRFPEAVALVYEGERLTYRELDERANQIAHHLNSLGMEPGTWVALSLERSIEMVIGILGILKARGAYLPLDPDYPRERLALMLEDSRAPFLLTREGLVERVSGSSALIVDLDSALREPGAASRRRPSLRSVAEDAAYVIYTSGSTGKPKGVMVTHANVLRLFAATAASFGFTERDVWTLFHSVAFDFSVWEMWGALLHGGRLVVVPYLTSRSPEAFHGLLGAEGVTVLSQTPSAFRQLIRAEEELRATGTLDLSWVVFGGEALDLQSLAPWFARHGDQHPRLINMYGITETTVHVTYREISTTDLALPGSPLGRPIDDLRIVLLDRHLQLVPVGVHGEIHVGGAGLARGYLGLPALTAERFVPDLWSPGQGGRLYRTGDLARRVPGGDLLYLGRRDHQVKIRGFRLEPGEIEAALMSHPAIRQAVVVAREEGGERRLVSYLVPRDADEPGPEELRAHLRGQLPEHAIPAAFVFLPELPLTPSGKVDRRALPVPQSTRSGLTTAYREPRTVVERVLARIWAHALGLPRVGIHDNFFALGGDSIRSIGILSAARDQGLAISLQQIFLHQTIAELAPEARPETGRDRVHLQPFALLSAEDQARLPAGIDDAYPLSRLQAGMLFHMTAMPGSAAYHNVNSHHLSGRFEPESFAAALGQVIERHPVLRTSFDLGTFSEPMQLVHLAVDVPFAVEDWTLLDPEAQEQALVELVERERTGRFDPLRAPQIRFHVVRRGPRDFQLTVTENHAILDGWSLHAALTEIFDRYLALLDGKSTESVPPPAATMRDFVYLERLALESVEARKFWAATLDGVTATVLPRWPGGPSEVFGQRVRDHGVGIAPGAFERLHALAIARGVPLKSLLLAAHVKALSLLTGRMDVVTGLTSHGRIEEEGGEKALGLFLNTLPFRLRLAPGSWLDLARQVFAAEQAMLPFRRFPLAELQRLEGGAALFDTQFNFVHFHIVGEILRSGRLEVLGARKAEETNLALLVGFSADPATSRLGLELNWDSAQFSRAEVEAIGALFARVLEAMAADLEARHEGSSWFTEAGRQQILREWNDTTANEKVGACIQELVLARARREPSALAVAHAGGRMTYGELAARASSLADELRAIGVGPETVVAIAIESPPERIVGLLGILVAGGAYLPLDLAYPPERLTYMLDDARPRVLLTEETLRDRLPATKVPVLCLNADQERSTRWDSEPPAIAVSADNLAYVIYTSGSTGRPKGVEVPHRGLLNLIRWHLETYSVGPDDRATQMAAPSFDAAVWEIWPYLAAGASLWFPEPETRSSPPLLTAWLVERSITLSFLPTPLAEAMLDTRWPEELALRALLTGGDRLRRLPAEAPPFRLINHYGPTESSVVTTMTPVSLPAAPGAPAPPIGRPIAGLRVYLLDEAAQPVAIGVPGELHIAGVGLARGYRDRPDWTAERFVPDPFALRRGGRLYRTGDLGRYLPDGQIEFIGRRDEQVKIRGFRIELAEIEVALLAFQGVRQAGVLVHEDDAGRARLVAYWVPTDPPGPTTEELRLWLQRTLPAPMVPSLFVALDELPLSPNGKLDRRALPAPASVVPQVGAELPQDETEERLAVLWAEVLGIERVGIHDNFFELGGDSILSLQIVARAHRVGLWFHAGQIFEHPTVAELARVAGRRSTADTEQGIVTGPVPLTPIQQWFFARHLPTPHHYNQAVLLEVSERLAPVLLDRVLAALTAHHDALRLRFERDEADENAWRQTLAALEFRPAFSLIDLSRLPASARGASVEEAGAALEMSLDLGAGPLARLALFDLGEAEAERLLFTCHHLVVDGVSWRLLLADLETAYRQLERGEAVDLGPKTTSFQRWAVRLEEYARSKAVGEELGYWLAAERIELPKLPVDLPSPGENTESSVRFVSAALSLEETRVLLREVPEVYNTQINDVLLTALAFAFARWTDVPRLRVDVEGHGREEIAGDLDLSRTVGWFTTLFPVVLDLRGVSGPGEGLKAIKEQLRAIPARGLGYGLLRYLPGPEIGEGLSLPQPVEVSFNYLGQFDGVLAGSSPFRVARESAGLLHGPRQPRAHLLEVGASVEGGELRTAWEWSAHIHRRETIESLAGSFIEALREIIEHCQSTQGDYTPSDFPDVERLDQERLEKIFDEMELS